MTKTRLIEGSANTIMPFLQTGFLLKGCYPECGLRCHQACRRILKFCELLRSSCYLRKKEFRVISDFALLLSKSFLNSFGRSFIHLLFIETSIFQLSLYSLTTIYSFFFPLANPNDPFCRCLFKYMSYSLEGTTTPLAQNTGKHELPLKRRCLKLRYISTILATWTEN